ncbi:hypothetical protein BG000_003703 [Podila horticola]|nr:hypothetical protein BG000_003703 [Podila horticola]
MIASTTYPQPWLPAQDHRSFEHSVVMDSGTTAPQPSSNTPQPHHQEQKRSRHRSRCRTLSKDDSEDQEETRPLLHPAAVVIDGITETYLPHDPSTLISSPEAGVSTTQDFYALYNPPDSKLWSIASTMVIASVAVISKTFMTFGAQTSVHNINPFLDVLCDPKRTRSILTDDPLLWGTLPWKCYWSPSRTIRYALGAQELCYPNKTIGAFFQCGQVVPIVRGNGIFQPAIDESIRLLQQGKWVHVFPEGKVNQSSELIRLKWGIGRILLELAGRPVTVTTRSTTTPSPQFSHITDSKDIHNNSNNDGRTWDQIKDSTMPIVVPIYHFGMDDILRLYPDNSSPVFPKWGLPLTIVFGEPIDFSKVMIAYKNGALDEVEARVRVTAMVHAALEQLQAVAQTLHEDQVQRTADKQRRARSQSVLNVARALSWIKPVGWGWWQSPDLVMPKD